MARVPGRGGLSVTTTSAVEVKRTRELDEFIDDFEVRHGLRLDWVYEAKMMYALFHQVARNAFPRGTTIVALISGSGDVPARDVRACRSKHVRAGSGDEDSRRVVAHLCVAEAKSVRDLRPEDGGLPPIACDLLPLSCAESCTRVACAAGSSADSLPP